MASGRLDNRRDLIPVLGSEGATDAELMLQAYLRWHHDAPVHIDGDWSFAAWHPQQGELFLARDRIGTTALHYVAGPDWFAFSSSATDLIEWDPDRLDIDELYLAQVLLSWPAYYGERTVRKAIKRLPPSHCLMMTPRALTVRCYWRLEETPPLVLKDRGAYVEAFKDAFDTAVEARVANTDTVGISLSGGLDSSSVAATAAGLMRRQGRRLLAFTSVPVADTTPYEGPDFGDELPFASATATKAGNIDLQPISGKANSPVRSIRRALEIWPEPRHAAGSAYWLLAVREAARDAGCQVLLNGQLGNAGISWTGSAASLGLRYQLVTTGMRATTKNRMRPFIPGRLRNARRRQLFDTRWYRRSAIHPDLVDRLHLLDELLADPQELPTSDPREERLRVIQPGRSILGAISANVGATFGLSERDPTADARLLALCLSIPDKVFIDPETGMDRWLIREAMRDRLPDAVRLNRRRGRQSADLVPRLRATAAEVEEALAEIDRGPANAFVDAAYMLATWRRIQIEDTPEAYRLAVTVLTRGIMAGLWVNDFYDRPVPNPESINETLVPWD